MAKPVRILVVDHSKMSQNALAHVLRDQVPGARVTCCESAKAAIEHLRRGERFDMISTSLMLADMDGLDLVRNLRTMGRTHNVPVVVVSAQAEQRFSLSGDVPGVSDYFDKSRGVRALGGFIKDFVERNFVEGRVLYVEDDLVAGKKTQQLLERHGFEVVHVTGVDQAEALLEQTGSCGSGPDLPFFDVVLSDFFLRGGGTAARLLHTIRVRLQYSPRQLPVLVVTVSDDPDRQVEAFRAGANDFVTKPYVEDILLGRVRSLVLLSKQFKALHRQAEELRRLASTDTLTGAHNRGYFNEFGGGFLEATGHRPAAAMLIDIDHLTRINRDYGNLRGDRLLREVADLLRRQLGEEAMVTRYGGEEFCCLIPHCTATRAVQLGEQVCAAMRSPGADALRATLSVGVASARDFPDAGLEALVRKADSALSRAKDAGRDRVVAVRRGHSS